MTPGGRFNIVVDKPLHGDSITVPLSADMPHRI